MPPKKKKFKANKTDQKELEEFKEHLKKNRRTKLKEIVRKVPENIGITKEINGLGRMGLKDMKSEINECKAKTPASQKNHSWTISEIIIPDSLLANGYE